MTHTQNLYLELCAWQDRQSTADQLARNLRTVPVRRSPSKKYHQACVQARSLQMSGKDGPLPLASSLVYLFDCIQLEIPAIVEPKKGMHVTRRETCSFHSCVNTNPHRTNIIDEF
ncbi:hypothetical protein TNCV_1421771 [Trichonephila clavipes]|nr:hypothetical protein TNCV_1421771 [Trichonephila clavipes]